MSAATEVTATGAILPSDEQAEVIDFIERLRAKGRGSAIPTARIVDSDGAGVEIPDSMFAVLVQVAESLKAGLAVTIAPQHMMLSTQEAADLLRVSRTTLVRLLESGIIPFDKPNRHRKIRLQDLLEYRQRQRVAAEHALDDMVADAQRLGLYDVDPDAVAEALGEARRGPAR